MEALIKHHFFTLAKVGLVFSLLCITTLSLMPSDGLPGGSINDKVQHAAAFFILAYLTDCSFEKSPFGTNKFLGLMLYGLFIELLQWNTGYRYMEAADLMADGIGVGIYIIATPLLKRLPLIHCRWTLLTDDNKPQHSVYDGE